MKRILACLIAVVACCAIALPPAIAHVAPEPSSQPASLVESIQSALSDAATDWQLVEPNERENLSVTTDFTAHSVGVGGHGAIFDPIISPVDWVSSVVGEGRNITGVEYDAAGRLWIATEDGDVYYSDDGRSLHLVCSKLFRLCHDFDMSPDGAVYLTTHGIAAIRIDPTDEGSAGPVTATLPDSNLYSAVCGQLRAKRIAYASDDATHTVSLSSMAHTKLTSLSLNNCGISSVEGLGAFTNLRELEIANDSVSDLTPLGDLTSLQKLVAYGNVLTDAAKLPHLPSLTYVDLAKNALVDDASSDASCTTRAVAQAFPKLKHLDLAHNLVRYTAGLNTMGNLEHVDLYDNAVRDLTGLAGASALPALAHLDLGQNNERNVTSMAGLDALDGLEALAYLDFSENNTPDIVSHLGNAHSLEFLQLQGNGIADASALASATELKTLVLANNDLADVSAFAALIQLEELNLQGNQLTSTGLSGTVAEGAAAWPNLKKLDVSNNRGNGFGSSAEAARLFELSQQDAFEMNFDYDYISGYDAHAITPAYAKLSELPHNDAAGSYVTYEDFGARANGTYDDFIAIRNAHMYANAKGCEVRATQGKTYHIFRPYDTQYRYVSTNVDWTGATFVIHDEDIENKAGRYTPLLVMRGLGAGADDMAVLGAKDGTAPLGFKVGTGTQTVAGLSSELDAAMANLKAKGYDRFYLQVENSAKRQYVRYGSNANGGSAQWDGFIVDAEGNVEGGVQWDFDQLTYVQVLPLASGGRSYVKGGTFQSLPLSSKSETPYTARGGGKPIYYNRNLDFRQCGNLDVTGIVNTVPGENGVYSGSYCGFVNLHDCADVNMADCTYFARKFSRSWASWRSTYGVSFSRNVNLSLAGIGSNEESILDDTRYGIIQTDHNKHVTLRGCALNRMDAHEGIYDLTVRDCTIGIKGFQLTGQGPLTIQGCTVKAAAFLPLRGDYGSTWDGSVRIIDCTHEYHGNTSQRLVDLGISYEAGQPQAHDFGYPLRFPDLYVENLTVDESHFDPAAAPGKDEYFIIPNRTYDGAYKLPAEYWPDSVTVNGIRFTNYENVRHGSETESHAPYYRLTETREGGIGQAAAGRGERSFWTGDAHVRRASPDGADVTEALMLGEELSSPEPLYLLMAPSEADSVENSYDVYCDGTLVEHDVKVEGDVTRAFAAPGAYEVRLRSHDARSGWDATRTLSFTVEGDAADAHPGRDLVVAGKSADDIVRDMKIGWNLGNTLESYRYTEVGGVKVADTPEQFARLGLDAETLWANPKTTDALIAFVKEQGFNAVRIPVSWFLHITPQDGDPYHIDEAWMARVHEVVDYCYDHGLYIILNTHHEKLWLETPQFGDADARPALKAELTSIWKQIATEFKDYDQRLVFEGLNEPRAVGEGVGNSREWSNPTAGDLETLDALNQAFVDTVRSVDSPYRTTRLLVASMYAGSTQAHIISQLHVPQDPYICVSAHPYMPWAFTASPADEASRRWITDVFDAVQEVELERVLYRMYAQFTSKNIPVVLDEFNAADKNNTAERVKWANKYLDLARGYGMTCFLWDAGGSSASLNGDGNRTGYIDRRASPVTWVNGSQETVAKAIIEAATGNGATAWRSACTTAVPTGRPEGMQLNRAQLDFSVKANNVYQVRWSDLEGGNVAVEFAGAAPTLFLSDAGGHGAATEANGWMGTDPSYVRWNEGATGGTAYWFADHLKRLWLTGNVGGTPNTTDNLRQIIVSGTAGNTASRVVLADAEPAPGTSEGVYGARNVKLLYTRPYTVKPGTATTSVLISTTNPDVDGCDFAIRYSGATPRLVFTYQWYFASDASETDSANEGWAHIAPYETRDVGGGEKVSLYSRAAADSAWASDAQAKALAEDGKADTYNNMFVWVSGADWDELDSGDCNIIEVVALDVPERKAPTMRPASDVRTAAEIVADMKAGYNFSGSFEGQVPNAGKTKDGGYGQADLNLEVHGREGEHWPYLTEAMFAAVKKRGFKTVRLPCTWWQHMYEKDGDPYHIDEAWLARVHEAVDYALVNDLYVIVDTHHENWLERADFGSAYDKIVPVFDAVWTQIAHEFEGYDQRLIFEGMNEPRASGEGIDADREWNKPSDDDIATINRLNAHFAELVHETLAQPDRICLCSVYGGHPELAQIGSFEIPAGDRVAASVHPYTPFSFAHDTSASARLSAGEAVDKPYTDANAAELDSVMQGVKETFTDNGIPVVFDEFGSFYYGPGNEKGREQWMRQWATWAKKLGAPGVIWPMESAAQHYTFDRATCTWPETNAELLDIWFNILEDSGDEREHEHTWGDWIATVPATCTDAGEEERVCSGDSSHVETRSTAALGHDWTAPVYTWSEDNSTVEARSTCAHDATHVRTETAQTVCTIGKTPSETEKGELLYTASFASDLFATQVKTVEILPIAIKSHVETSGERMHDVEIEGLDELTAAVYQAERKSRENTGSDNEQTESITSVSIVMTVEKKDEHEAEGAARIREKAMQRHAPDAGNSIDIEFLDVSLVKEVKAMIASGGSTSESTTTQSISDTSTTGETGKSIVLTIAVPFDYSNKSGIEAYRFHDGEATMLVAVNAKPDSPKDGTCYLDRDAGFIYIYATKFSTYAIKYEITEKRDSPSESEGISDESSPDVKGGSSAGEANDEGSGPKSSDSANDTDNVGNETDGGNANVDPSGTGGNNYADDDGDGNAGSNSPDPDSKSNGNVGNDNPAHTGTTTGTTTDTGNKSSEGSTSSGEDIASSHVHDWSEWVLKVPATCTENGIEERTCKADPTHVETRTVQALGHSWSNAYTIDILPTTSAEGSESIHCARCDATKGARPVPKLASNTSDSISKPVLVPKSPVFHLTQRNGSGHLYTASSTTMVLLKKAGWRLESIAFFTPKTGKKVYELVQRKSGMRYYTTSLKQVKAMKRHGWKKTGVAFRSLKGGGVAVYRMKNASTGAYRLAKGKKAMNALKKKGWKNQGIALRAVS